MNSKVHPESGKSTGIKRRSFIKAGAAAACAAIAQAEAAEDKPEATVVVVHGKDIAKMVEAGMEKMGPVTQKLYDTLTGIQMGRIEAPEGWIVRID